MVTFEIGFETSQLTELLSFFDAAIGEPGAALPNTAKAFVQATHLVRDMWTDMMYEIPGVTSAMVRSIRDNIKEKGPTAMNYTVYSDNREMEKLNSAPDHDIEYDMKKTHPFGKKSRVSKKGIPYLIIPFRWGTPNGKGTKRAHSFFSNVIPTKQYNTSIRPLNLSRVISEKAYYEANAKGEMIPRKGYEWIKGSRLSDDQAWDDRSVGMVRMRDVTGSTYFTFRIISAKSPAGSWIYRRKGNPGGNFMSKLVDKARPLVQETIDNGLKADLQIFN